MRKVQFVETEIYHIYNRGVEKREIFHDETDYFRFLHNLYEFNDANPALNVNYYFNTDPKSVPDFKKREILVEILIFTLMPNHFHIILKQKKKDGIKTFMHKLGTGYAMYFNNKYKRSGILFQGRFKSKIVDRESYYIQLPFYIHSNPLKLNYGGPASIDFLEKYRWSSFLDYIGRKNFPSITSRKMILDYFGGEQEYKKAFEKWMKTGITMEARPQ